jgi:hypothetical protein
LVLLLGAIAVAFAARSQAHEQVCQRTAASRYCLAEIDGTYKHWEWLPARLRGPHLTSTASLSK